MTLRFTHRQFRSSAHKAFCCCCQLVKSKTLQLLTVKAAAQRSKVAYQPMRFIRILLQNPFAEFCFKKNLPKTRRGAQFSNSVDLFSHSWGVASFDWPYMLLNLIHVARRTSGASIHTIRTNNRWILGTLVVCIQNSLMMRGTLNLSTIHTHSLR